ARDGQQYLARHRDDEGHDHDREKHPRGEEPYAVYGTVEERDPAERVGNRGAERADDGYQHEDADQPVDDARHGYQELDQKRQGIGQPPGQQLGEANRGPETHGNGENERDRRGG